MTTGETIRASSFFGEKIGDMDREKLFEIIAHLSNELESYRGMGRAIALGKVEMLKRGEAA